MKFFEDDPTEQYTDLPPPKGIDMMWAFVACAFLGMCGGALIGCAMVVMKLGMTGMGQ